MFNIKKVLGLDVCCYKKFIKNRFNNLVTLVNVSILYNFTVTIYNYSYNIGYNFTNTILYINENMLAEAILESFRLVFLIIAICFWLAISHFLSENIECNKH
jgi:hypothetical protein